MNFYTFENTNTKTNEDGDTLYDFFEKTMVNDTELIYGVYTVTNEYSGRLDLICKMLYGNTDYMEELMVQNGIINPFSVKTDDNIYYSYSSNELGILYQKDVIIDKDTKEQILNINKNKSSVNNELPPSVNPGNIKAVNVNYNKKVITIMNKLN